jgi:hypothetical protein
MQTYCLFLGLNCALIPKMLWQVLYFLSFAISSFSFGSSLTIIV